MKRIILFLLLLPMVKANDYTNNGYGQGVYGFGEEEPGTPILSSDGNVIGKVAQSKDGGCWSYANNDNTCYYLNNSQCILGCPDDLSCNEDYDFESITTETLDYCYVGEEKIKKRVFSLAILVGIIILSILMSVTSKKKNVDNRIHN